MRRMLPDAVEPGRFRRMWWVGIVVSVVAVAGLTVVGLVVPGGWRATVGATPLGLAVGCVVAACMPLRPRGTTAVLQGTDRIERYFHRPLPGIEPADRDAVVTEAERIVRSLVPAAFRMCIGAVAMVLGVVGLAIATGRVPVIGAAAFFTIVYAVVALYRLGRVERARRAALALPAGPSSPSSGSSG
jgi:hypothetical protein